ncbi:hypothetical protein FNYG_01348 [Fusarium nygamai]|uniref:Uncharacterized protein n=1 Tax=Gibberella nygamai TaxID=42673 RepID=A0A2K0WSP9_GIBNY|nr:hypothetical protein FNYG_01348 [Fusarium nygamai]
MEMTDLLQSYDIPTDSWSTKSAVPHEVNHPNVAVVDNKLYLLGGLVDGLVVSGVSMNLVASASSYVHDVTSETWSDLAPMPNTTAQGSTDLTSKFKRVATVTSSFNPKNATLAEFNAHTREVALSRIGNSTTCNKDNFRVRKLFENLTVEERISYTDALKCLMDLRAKAPADLAAGAKSQYDNWVVTRINQTLTIHLNANFLGWNRWYNWEI